MIDFHAHFIPGIDDGASDPEAGTEILLESAKQGVTHIFATPHFYPDHETPEHFISRRNNALLELRKYIKRSVPATPHLTVMPGAEVYYYPGISDSEDIKKLKMGPYPLLLVEPPMSPWTEYMLDELESVKTKLGLMPVIAHVDRYARYLDDYSLFELLAERNIFVQVNASFFIRESTSEIALDLFENGMVDFIGSDAHNTGSRPQNIASAVKIISRNHAEALALFEKTLYNLLCLE